ncbi:MAG TPA: hypothetical protein ENN40_03690 [Candidatus Aminicenantes bacterium]|nr:hypothetical protein [Candidatus Aminicenantes bacterium]
MTKDEVIHRMERMLWYHTVELAPGVVTPGQYDHRPLLHHYGIPEDLSGKTVLDVGPAHGFFAFEFERRKAARVVTLELEKWTDHDVSPFLRERFMADNMNEIRREYLNEALAFAIQVKQSGVEQRSGNIYDLDPHKTGIFDITFCGSLLVHLTDPLRALYALRGVTREMAILSTVIHNDEPTDQAVARFIGRVDSEAFWIPNMCCLKEMALAAGFSHVEEVSTFNLASVDKEFNSLHGTIKAHV